MYVYVLYIMTLIPTKMKNTKVQTLGGIWQMVLLERPKKHFKNEQRSKDAAAKKRPNTSGVGKINNYCEDIYPPYNNTH